MDPAAETEGGKDMQKKLGMAGPVAVRIPGQRDRDSEVVPIRIPQLI
jgi:hypothetical protein